MTVEEIIELSHTKERYYPLQIDIKSSEGVNFARWVCERAEVLHIQKMNPNLRREDWNVSYDTLLKRHTDILKASFKITHLPICELMSYEKWEGGYIECFYCSKDDKFIFAYLRMEHLTDLLTKFHPYLIVFK